MQPYSAADLKRLFGLSAALLRSLTHARLIQPMEQGDKSAYSFQDLLVLRTAAALRSAKVPSSRITDALSKIRAALPDGTSLSALSLTPQGKHITVRDGMHRWEAASGQYALLLAESSASPKVSKFSARGTIPSALRAARRHFDRAYELEASNVASARAAYLDCLVAHKEHLEARINLGRLLHLEGELGEAEKIYRRAKSSSATLSYNLGVLLEDMHREEEAMVSYREALALDPALHDAHFNLARLHEHANHPREALRHLLAYRRLAGRDANAVD